ncbi:MAG: alpha/beta fold hydrolase [Alphaproteobacteria bacterium]
MRKGPHPLAVQLGLAASAQGVSGDFLLQDEGVVREDLKAMLLGIQRYQQASFVNEREPLEVIWQQGTTTLQSIPGRAIDKNNPVILLIPSMVNRGYILDLMPGRSMLRWFADQGITSYLLDWGEGVGDPGQQSVEDIIMQRLVPGIEYAAKKSGRAVNVLGYCMGGTLLAGAAIPAAKSIDSLIFLAAPWDFHAGAKNMLARVQFWAPSAFPAIAEKGFLPKDWMQILFASLNPDAAARKFSAFVKMKENSEEFRLFIAVEDWLNDGVDLPGAVAQHCIKSWFFENATAAQKWQIGGRPVTLEAIQSRVLVIASKTDRLVDYEAATALAESIPGAELITPPCGHVGMIAGAGAIEKVWRPVADWIRKK